MTGVGNLGDKFGIKIINDFLNIKPACVTPRRRAFRDIAFILFLSSTVSCPAKAGNAQAYVILDMIRPVNN